MTTKNLPANVFILDRYKRGPAYVQWVSSCRISRLVMVLDLENGEQYIASRDELKRWVTMSHKRLAECAPINVEPIAA